MADGRGKWMPFKSANFDKFYGKDSDVTFDILGLNLKIVEKFYTKFEAYWTSPFDYLPFKFEMKVCKF